MARPGAAARGSGRRRASVIQSKAREATARPYIGKRRKPDPPKKKAR